MKRQFNNMTVFVVDDDPDLCKAIAVLLRSVRLAAETYTDPREFLKSFDGSRGGCILLDVRMPGLNGLQVQQKLRDRGIMTPVVMISGHGDIPMAMTAARAGALDFIEKPFREGILLQSVRHALALDQKRIQSQRSSTAIQDRIASLSRRQAQVARLVAKGMSNRLIAERLKLSPRTVEMHRADSMKKLGVQNTAELTKLLLTAE